MSLLDKITASLPSKTEANTHAPEQLAGFKRSQALAYQCAIAVERQLQVGMTERDAAGLLHEAFSARGVCEYFHQPFAWFGERTAFARFHHPLQFFPTAKKLELGMPVILDVAPVIDGYTSDVGYACKLGENALHDQMVADLEPYRQLILDGVRARKHLNVIYRDVDRLIERQGYDNRHRVYPFRVLAHRVNYVPPEARTQLSVAGFGAPALSYLFGRAAQALRSEASSPFWNDQRSSAHPAQPGLWAVEPHLGFRGVGVKWEELLVVTEHDAYWLDDDLPHVRRFRARHNPPKFEVLA